MSAVIPGVRIDHRTDERRIFQGHLRVLAEAVAHILMIQVESFTLYVTPASPLPGVPFSAPSGSTMPKVMESLVTAVTFQTRLDLLFVPLCRVLLPSFCSVMYVLPSREYMPFPIRPTYR